MRTFKGRVKRSTGRNTGPTSAGPGSSSVRTPGRGVRSAGPKRQPRPDEIASPWSSVDRLLADERQMQAHGRNPEHPSLYHAESVAIMDAVIAGSPVDPDAMWRVLDLLDQFHRSVEALDISRNAHNRARRELRDMLAE